MQQADKFVIRLPEGMRDRIRQNAEANRRTMNAEILHYIDKALVRDRSIMGSEIVANEIEREMATAGASLATEPAAAEDHNTRKECCDAANT